MFSLRLEFAEDSRQPTPEEIIAFIPAALASLKLPARDRIASLSFILTLADGGDVGGRDLPLGCLRVRPRDGLDSRLAHGTAPPPRVSR